MSEAGRITEDAFLGGQLRLRQPKSGHRAGHDAMLLAAATPARPGDRVVDFGAGVGAAGLALARRVGAIELVLVEIDAALAALARGNAACERDRGRRHRARRDIGRRRLCRSRVSRPTASTSS